MLDARAWIIAGLILLAAAGAYVVWITRPRAQYAARSLSAAGRPADQPNQWATKSLHVQGCREDFIVSPGEIVAPRVAPDASIDQFRSVYGPEAKKAPPFTWKTEEFDLNLTQSSPKSPTSALRISVNSGHIVETLDGVELGLDSFATILHKMQDKKVEIHERIRRDTDQPPGHWILTVTLFSACGRKFRSEYWRSITSDPETDALINRRVTGGNGQTGLIRSDIFMNKVVYDYTMESSNGSGDDPAAGEPSEHD